MVSWQHSTGVMYTDRSWLLALSSAVGAADAAKELAELREVSPRKRDRKSPPEGGWSYFSDFA